MRRVVAAAALGTILAACSASSKQVRGPDGKLWWAIRCKHAQDNCLEEAGERCPGGYVVADASGGTVGAVMNDGIPGVVSVTAVYRGSMLVQCKPGGEAAASP